MQKITTGIIALCFLLLPATLFAKGAEIEGVWKLVTAKHINYKVLKSNGTYINLRSGDGGKTFYVTRMGNYEIAAPGVYIEHLRYENGCPGYTPFTLSYRKEKNKLELTFDLNGTICQETWEKVRSSAYRQKGITHF